MARFLINGTKEFSIKFFLYELKDVNKTNVLIFINKYNKTDLIDISLTLQNQ